tara:strand:- start:69 stop:437 length:369 start_codon:yes stop_codon:yes gene_type:complete
MASKTKKRKATVSPANQKRLALPDFDYVENPKDPDQHAIRIIDGHYKGIVYTYGVVGFEEEKELTISFSYDIIENPKKIDVLDDIRFRDIMGDILTIILKYNVSDKKDAGKSRNNDIEKSGN